MVSLLFERLVYSACLDKPHKSQWVSKWITFTTVDADGKIEKEY